MFFLQYKTKQKSEQQRESPLGGAYANCWIVRDTQADADTIARQLVDGLGWIVETLEMAHPISRADYESSPEGLEHYEQAEIDGEVVVFHTWPVGGEDQSEKGYNPLETIPNGLSQF